MDTPPPVVKWIARLELDHPTRIGLDGRSAAGKTTLADALAELVQSTLQRPVVRASIDNFDRPGHLQHVESGSWFSTSRRAV